MHNNFGDIETLNSFLEFNLRKRGTPKDFQTMKPVRPRGFTLSFLDTRDLDLFCIFKSNFGLFYSIINVPNKNILVGVLY